MGRLAFKAREGRQTALSGFDSHSLPPIQLFRCWLGMTVITVASRRPCCSAISPVPQHRGVGPTVPANQTVGILAGGGCPPIPRRRRIRLPLSRLPRRSRDSDTDARERRNRAYISSITFAKECPELDRTNSHHALGATHSARGSLSGGTTKETMGYVPGVCMVAECSRYTAAMYDCVLRFVNIRELCNQIRCVWVSPLLGAVPWVLI